MSSHYQMTGILQESGFICQGHPHWIRLAACILKLCRSIMNTYRINERDYSLALPFSEECLLPEQNTLYDLSYLSSIEITGEKAAGFLQGQLSCDVNQVHSDTMRLGIYCTLQGRIQSLLSVLNWNGWYLVLPDDTRSNVMTSLAKTALVSRVKLLACDDFSVYGLYLKDTSQPQPFDLSLPAQPFALTSNEHSACYALGQGCYIILTRNRDKLSARGSLGWHRLQLALGHVELYPDTQGKLLPHRLDLQKKNYISFDKGCYKGQEIIARTHYRAKLKHSMGLYLITTNEPLRAGCSLFNATSGAECGELVDYCPVSQDQFLIAASMRHEHGDLVLFESHTSPTRLMEQPLLS